MLALSHTRNLLKVISNNKNSFENQAKQEEWQIDTKNQIPTEKTNLHGNGYLEAA